MRASIFTMDSTWHKEQRQQFEQQNIIKRANTQEVL